MKFTSTRPEDGKVPSTNLTAETYIYTDITITKHRLSYTELSE